MKTAPLPPFELSRGAMFLLFCSHVFYIIFSEMWKTCYFISSKCFGQFFKLFLPSFL